MTPDIFATLHRDLFSDTLESTLNGTCIPISYGLNSACRPLKASWLLNFDRFTAGRLSYFSRFVNSRKCQCRAQGKMSPLMPKLKCPHERGEDLDEPEAVTEVSSCWVGRKWKNYFRGGCSENRGLLPASQANLQKDQGKRSLGTPAWECRPLSSTWNLRFIAKEHPSL